MNKALENKVKEIFDKSHAPGHPFEHPKRVSFYAREIARSERYDEKEAWTAGLLHDMGRTVTKEHKGHDKAGVPIAKKLLDEYTAFSNEVKDRILDAIGHHSDKFTEGELSHIVQDADKIDGLGAIGVLRVANTKYLLPEYREGDFKLTIQTASDNPQTLYEQLIYQIRWMEMFYTEKGKELAKPRHEFMLTFLDHLRKELEESGEKE